MRDAWSIRLEITKKFRMKQMPSRAAVPALERVACWYIAAKGSAVIGLLATSSKDVMPYS